MSEFLEGHHPVDVTESELLQILLDWLIQFASGSSQDYSNLASVLLRKIRWNEIRYDDILKVISSGMAILTQYLDSELKHDTSVVLPKLYNNILHRIEKDLGPILTKIIFKLSYSMPKMTIMSLQVP